MRKYYHTIFNLLALSVIICIGVELFYLIITAQLQTSNTQDSIVDRAPNAIRKSQHRFGYYEPIMKRNIFGSKKGISGEKELEGIEDLQPTSLQLALWGTASGNPQNAFAVIEEIDKKKQGLYRVGDSIKGAIVKKIVKGKVILKVDERDEILNIKEGSPLGGKGGLSIPEITNEGDKKVINRSDIQESMENLHRLLSQVRVRPYFRNGKADGLSVTNIKSGSFFAKLGLKNGDVVQGIDDRIINSPEDVLDVYKKFKLGSQVALTIMRNNEQKILTYEFR